MTFNNETTVTPCLDEMSVPKTVYNFVSIDKISALEVGSIIGKIFICLRFKITTYLKNIFRHYWGL